MDDYLSRVVNTFTTTQNSIITNEPEYSHNGPENDLNSASKNLEISSKANYHKSVNDVCEILPQLQDRWSPLYELLQEWGLETIYEILLRIQAKFEYYLQRWQKHHGIQFESLLNTSKIVDSPCRVDSPATSNSNISIVSDDQSDDTPSNKVKLREILNTAEGQMILQYFDKHKELNPKNRQILNDLIVQHFIVNKKKMTVSIADDISKQIVTIFTNEPKEYYFAAQYKKAPKGKLYNKYQNDMHKLVKCGLLEKNSSVTSITTKVTSFEVEENYEELVVRLRTEDMPWEQIEILWEQTCQGRLKSIRENNDCHTALIQNLWKQYSHPMGYRLIELDYSQFMNNADGTSIVSEWTDFFLKTSQIFLKKFGTNFEINEVDSEEGKNAYLLWYLHALKPSSKKVTKDATGKKSIYKFTIRDSQMSFFMVEPTAAALLSKMQEILSKGNRIQPMILIVGTIKDPKEIMGARYGIQLVYCLLLIIELWLATSICCDVTTTSFWSAEIERSLFSVSNNLDDLLVRTRHFPTPTGPGLHILRSADGEHEDGLKNSVILGAAE
ncbi:unnamed protein product [Psylliodes chrysocephalus]|uniref:Uncharacterized protein n=1 Tax=Psylliodes chrysocephalus TaxID=3402493 RepID=A0A9P0CRP2_9CUCU|nr:unnamed protein product [Psylliodes chrysocephala]